MEDSVFLLPDMHPFSTAMFNEGNLQFDRPDHVLFCPNELSSVDKRSEAVASPQRNMKGFSPCLTVSSVGSNMSNGVDTGHLQVCAPETCTSIGNDDDSSCVCKDCGKKFSERSLLLRHRVVHAEAKYVCEFCQRAFVRDDKLKRHIRCVHSHERPFVCEVCAKAFARKDKLQEHARHHNRDITFPCPVCPDLFVMRSHLNRHLRTVHNLKYTPVTQSSSAAPTASCTMTGPGDSQRNGNKHDSSGVGTLASAANGRAQQQTPTTQFASGTEMVLTPISTNPSDKRSRRKSTTTKRSKLSVMTTEQPHQQLDEVKSNTEPLSSNFGNSNPYASAFSAPMLSNNSSNNNNNSGSVNLTTNFLFGQPNVYQTIQQQPPQHSQVNFTSDTRLAYPNGIEAPLSVHQQQQQQQQQQALGRYDPIQSGAGPQTQSALSAAMAASLLAPVNYVGWWHQSNPSLMLPYAQSNQLGSRGEPKHGCASLTANDSGAYGQLATGLSNLTDQASTRAQPGLHLDPSSSASTPQSWLATGAVHPSRSAHTKSEPAYYSSAMPYPASAHMLASLNPFAQAMYYQAASLAASQNGQPASTSGSDPHVPQSTDGLGEATGQVTGSPFFS